MDFTPRSPATRHLQLRKHLPRPRFHLVDLAKTFTAPPPPPAVRPITSSTAMEVPKTYRSPGSTSATRPTTSSGSTACPRPPPSSRSRRARARRRRACAVVREVLAMTVEKRTLVDHLTHFRMNFGLPNRLRALLVRHPELFYVSIKGVWHSAFLVKAFDNDGRLLVEDGMLVGRDRLEELVPEGKKIRQARKKGIFPVDGGDTDEDDEEDDNVAEGSSAVDGEFGDLFEQDSVAGEDWNEVGDGGRIEGATKKRILNRMPWRSFG
ncbi:hypothetical protein ZWY2020_006730 [Hordeum vulgare]|nr:hypothetical protein ZWY2020_006730 [Hordeum vulgare]